MGLLAVSFAARLLAGCWLLWRVPGLPQARREAKRQPIAVVVPARNEERRLPPLLRTVRPQLREGDELIVVDDHSEDGTAELAREAGASVVPAPPVRDGWTGKAWACWTGAAATTGQPVLVFLDADVELATGALDRLVAELEDRGGLVSVQPYHRAVGPVERLSAFFNVVGMMGTDAFTPLRRVPAGAFGPVLATSRADYDAVGGHRAVAASVLDDVELARRYRTSDRPVTCLAGRDAVTFRMYPEGFGSLIEGWTKNFAAGAAATRPLTLVLVVAWISACLSAPWWLATDPSVARAVAYGAVAMQLHWMLRRIGSFGLVTAVLFPIPLALFVLVFARSLLLTVFGRRVRWRGRDVPLRQRKIVRRK